MPDPSFLDTGIWGDAYRNAGGLVVPEYLNQQQAQEDLYGGYDEPAPAPQPEAPQLDESQFVNWPTYQNIVGGKLKPHEAYDEYLTTILPLQLKQMGYSPEDAQAEIQGFTQMVPPPAPDQGFFGNLWESAKGGFKSGTRAEQAAGNLVTGDLDRLAGLVTEQATGDKPNAPLQRFQTAISDEDARDNFWDAMKMYASAAWDEKQGALDFLINQATQSYPSMVGGAGGAVAGSLGGPLGAFLGGMAGVGAGSGSVEIGSQILEEIANEAQRRGIDPRNTAAIREMINDPEVYNKLRSAAVQKGLTVGAADAAVSAFSLGMGKLGANALRNGSKLRAGGLASAGVLGESAGSATGEYLSQQTPGYKALNPDTDWSQVAGEFFGDFGPGASHVAIGALLPHQTQATPGNAPPIDELDEGDLPGAGASGPELVGPPMPSTPFQGGIDVTELPPGEEINYQVPAGVPRFGEVGAENIDVQPMSVEEINIGDVPTEPPPGGGGMTVREEPVEEITLQPAQAVDSAELRIRDGRLLPLLPPGRANPPLISGPAGVGTPQQLEALRVQEAATPQAIDLDLKDRGRLLQWLSDRGVVPNSVEQLDMVDMLLNVPANSRQAAIAEAVEGLAASPERGAEPLAQALLAISRSIRQDPQPRARAQAALESALPGVPLAEIPKVVASEAAQKVMDDLAAGVTNAPTTPAAAQPQPTTTKRGRGRPATGITNETPPIQLERPLGSNEPVPAVGGLGGLVSQLVGPGAESGNAAPVQQPRGGLRNRVNQEGTGGNRRGSPLAGRKGQAAAGDNGRAGAQPVGTSSAEGVPGELAPPIEVKLSTEPTPRMYGAQEQDVANVEALSEQRAADRAKKQTGGLGKKAEREKRRKIDAVVMDKAEYEKTYPGRNYDDDLEAITRATGGGVSENMGPGAVPFRMKTAGAANDQRATAQTRELPSAWDRYLDATFDLQADFDRATKVWQELDRAVEMRWDLAKHPLEFARGEDRILVNNLDLAADMRDSFAERRRVLGEQMNRIAQQYMDAKGRLGGGEITNELADPDTHDTYVSLSDADLLDMQHRTASENLRMLASRTHNPLARALALHMATLDMPTMLRLRRLDVPGKYVYQEYVNGRVLNDAVLLDPHKPLGRTVEAAIHEYTHAATTIGYYAPQTEEQRAAVRKIDALYEYVKSKVPESRAYGFKNAPEFISEAFSNFEFQKLLNSVMVPETNTSLWTAFKELVMQLVGRYVKRGSAMHKLLAEIEPLLSAERGGFTQRGLGQIKANAPNAGPPASDARANAVPSSAIVGTKDGARTFIAYAKDKNDPNTTYTLYPVTSDQYRGVKGAGVSGMTRAQVEQRIATDGSQVVPPASDTSVKSGTPKNTATKQVGYDSNGNLQSAAFEQKDGTWTYYESDDDVRTDPDARVTKGLSKDAVQRFITARGLAQSPPKTGTVKPNSSKPTSVGYEAASWARRQYQDDEGTLLNIGGKVGEAAVLRNSRVEKRLRELDRQYVEPVRKAGLQITERFGKSETEIFDLLQAMHVVERMANKMQQFYRGNLQGAELANKQQELQDKQTEAQNKVNAARGSNPAYVQAVEQELAPKLRAMANNTIDMQAQYGFLSRDEAENIKRAYDFYVPLQSEDKRTTVAKAATGASVSGDLTFPRMVEQMSRTVSRGEQNRVRNEVLKLVEADALKLITDKKTGATEVPVIVGPKHVIRYNKDTNSLDTGQDNFVFDKDAVDVYRNGERIRMKITDPSLLEALHPFTGEERPMALTMAAATLARISRIISIGKTSLNPAWPPFNFARDVLTANLNLPAGVSRAKFLAELVKPSNYASVLWNVGREALGKEPVGGYADARDAHAFISHRAFIGLDPIAQGVQAMFKPPLASFDKQHLYGLSQKGTKTGAAAAKMFELLSVYPQWAESVPRMAMYKAAIASGMSKEQAGIAAKNASVNFERRGKSNLSNYWIFANAKMQGIHALMKTAERAGTLKATMGAASIVALGALAASLGYEWSEKDKDGKSKYTKIPDFKKDSLLLLQANALGIPIPQEISPLYVLGNAAAEAAMGGTTAGKASARFITSVLNNLWPGSVAQADPVGHNANMADFIMRMMVPSVASPLYDTATNKNTFGRPVVSKLDERIAQGIPKSDMGSPNENQLAVNVAKGLRNTTGIDVAPQQLKLWHNFFDPATEGFAFMRDLFGGREPKYVGDVVNPFARKFTGASTEFYDQEQFDELLANAKRAHYLIDAKNPNRVSIESLSAEDQVLAQAAKMLQKVESDGNNLFKGQKLMTPERRALLNERKRDLVLDGIRRYNEARDRTVPKR